MPHAHAQGLPRACAAAPPAAFSLAMKPSVCAAERFFKSACHSIRGESAVRRRSSGAPHGDTGHLGMSRSRGIILDDLGGSSRVVSGVDLGWRSQVAISGDHGEASDLTQGFFSSARRRRAPQHRGIALVAMPVPLQPLCLREHVDRERIARGSRQLRTTSLARSTTLAVGATQPPTQGGVLDGGARGSTRRMRRPSVLRMERPRPPGPATAISVRRSHLQLQIGRGEAQIGGGRPAAVTSLLLGEIRSPAPIAGRAQRAAVAGSGPNATRRTPSSDGADLASAEALRRRAGPQAPRCGGAHRCPWLARPPR